MGRPNCPKSTAMQWMLSRFASTSSTQSHGDERGSTALFAGCDRPDTWLDFAVQDRTGTVLAEHRKLDAGSSNPLSDSAEVLAPSTSTRPVPRCTAARWVPSPTRTEPR